MPETVIKIENLKKKYKLGAIGGQTLTAELQSWWARKRGKEDPNTKIGEDTAHYGENFWALNGINLEVEKGEAVGIIGSNGAGKSTLLKILSGVTAPTEGDVWIKGRIASMLEVGTGFHPELTGRENIYMNGAILGMTKKEVDEKIESIIDFSECGQFIDTPVKRYSSGMFVKLAFAVASHLDAEIMVMDEVLAVGDMKFQKKCLGKMGNEARNGRTVLYVSHNMNTIRTLCNRCVVLKKGEMIFNGDIESAISLYTEESKPDEVVVECSCKGLPRRNDLGRICHISHFRFINTEYPVYEAGEPIDFEVEFDSKQSINDVVGRIVIRMIDGENIAMSQSVKFNTGTGHNTIQCSFDSSKLTEGTYLFVFSLNETNEYGRSAMMDEVPQKIVIKITESTVVSKGKSLWISNYWGRIRLDEMKVKVL